MQIGFIVILIMAIFVAIFAIQNGTPVPIDLFFARYEMPLAVIMMICLILGAVMVLILGTTRQFKKRSEQKELKNKMKTLEAEKAEIDINIKALELDKENLNKTNEELHKANEDVNKANEDLNKVNEVLSVRISELENKTTEFEDKIKMQEESLQKKEQELEEVKIKAINSVERLANDGIETVRETIDEGVAQIDDEYSEVESQ